MKNLHILLVLFVGWMVTACNAAQSEEIITGTVVSPTFVQLYIAPEEVGVLESTGDSGYIGLAFKGTSITYKTAENSAEFDMLSKKYHDTSYNRRLVPYTNQVLKDAVQGIEIVSNHDFDAAHKAGTSLNDIVSIVATSPYQYILSGYKTAFDWHNDKPTDYLPSFIQCAQPGYWPVNKTVSELGTDETVLLHPTIYFKFDAQPEVEKNHTVTITLQTGGKTFTCSAELVFE